MMNLNQKAFTLIEMMIVMLVITVILAITIPNIFNQRQAVESKGCDAYIRVVESQVQSYKMKYEVIPAVSNLKEVGFIQGEELKCPDGRSISIQETGQVTVDAASEL
ncbi:competence type IV pilus major pilin ComGC [Mangrovibacillus cuniculi]|uniref:ComG operon protein 3 n=1 Tax=Mangrovibacillus cuniculi TaxID=2593652 RepID=A0A7S8CBD0_9BACI|nr:competence type IV pilus major pilin ComGC [Mangrovibacillus cuniculi]QPC46859.1 prepilin-type N-terminal cleavage/methylation domain-containing protein [Mangrovibacillus cuniculi]